MNGREEQFDEQMEEALGLLFEQFWVLRADEPEAYRLIRDREHKLKRYINDKFGFDYIMNSQVLWSDYETVGLRARPAAQRGFRHGDPLQMGWADARLGTGS